ncbi:hypothetical protein U9M48_000738 [Paspalum notatum var. saurae]|uniref:Uncharacterized protein n=1 Tax=Paspalum notatum var. saurae TaxID=547442 RepID=A0AAQ3PM21_PASNO
MKNSKNPTNSDENRKENRQNHNKFMMPTYAVDFIVDAQWRIGAPSSSSSWLTLPRCSVSLDCASYDRCRLRTAPRRATTLAPPPAMPLPGAQLHGRSGQRARRQGLLHR